MKVQLKLRRPHPTRSFRLGSHKITHLWASYDLSDRELLELKSKGCKHWIEEKKEEKKKPAKKSKPVADKKEVDGSVFG